MITLLLTMSSTLCSDLKGNFGCFLMLFEKGYAAFLSRYEMERLCHYRECLPPDIHINGGKYKIHNFETFLSVLRPFFSFLFSPSFLPLLHHSFSFPSLFPLPLPSFLLSCPASFPLINNDSRFTFHNLTLGVLGLSSQRRHISYCHLWRLIEVL